MTRFADLPYWIVFGAAVAALGGCTEVELDRMRGTAFPPEITRDGNIVSINSIYRSTGRSVGVAESTGTEADIRPLDNDCITDAELETLKIAHDGNPEQPIYSQYGPISFVHGIITNHYGTNDDGTCNKTLLGKMFDTADRSAFAMFYKKILDDRAKDVTKSDAYYLRSVAHEIGHTFNLHHGDGDGRSSLMDTGYTVERNVTGANVPYTFTDHARDHLGNHPEECVLPGSGKFGGCNALHEGYHGAMGVECP
jgi:hypothetical protein